MAPSKSLTAAIAAAAMVSVIGLAYAQTSNNSTQVRPGQTNQPAVAPGTMQGTTPSNAPLSGDTSSTTSPASTSTNMGNNMGHNRAGNDPNAAMTEREARADRN